MFQAHPDPDIRRSRIEILLLFIVYMVLLPRVYMEYDMGFWRQWALYLHQHGLAATYNAGSPMNYFPVLPYILYLFGLVQGTDAAIAAHINELKIVFSFFDFLPILVLSCFRHKLLPYRIPYLYLLLNIAYLFNSLVWGQIDAIYTGLAFLAIVAAAQYPTAGLMLYVLAFYTKPQAIVFLPVLLLVLGYRIGSWKALLKTLLFAGLAELLILLPFLHDGGLQRLLGFATGSVGLYHNLSISAFNFWYLAARGNPYFIHDTDTFILLSYHATGLLLFAAAALFALLPLARHLLRLRKDGLPFTDRTWPMVFLGTGLLCLYFFYFNTQMHERYAHPIILFFFFYGVASKNYRLYILASIPYYLSLDKAFSFPLGYLPIIHYKIIYASQVIALWYTAVVVYGSWLYWGVVWKGGKE